MKLDSTYLMNVTLHGDKPLYLLSLYKLYAINNYIYYQVVE